ncbi:helix-turn-helix transcriptional regulator [Tistrella mobilis]|uniref:AraC protein n=1 Tax=Tistrella mobilis (strain KA081020-065) TaxID=1110502 RepID=I3TXF0_TISMK|nr:helix-turn-helix transcriptional regulator [Tistrella mobilis]AFK57438.1 AraC protein [Tistrella mobilis KA081020-065]
MLTDRRVILRNGVGVIARVLQRRELLLTRIAVDQPTLMVVRRGLKLLRAAGTETVIPAGGAAAIAGGEVFDVVNRPDNGVYAADFLVIDQAVIAGFAVPDAVRPIARALTIPAMAPDFLEAYERARAAVADPAAVPETVAVQRMREVLGWIAHHGGAFPPPVPPAIAQRIRALVAGDLAAPWRAAEVASQLAMSEATLRRRLAAEGTSLTDLVTETRMAHALMLLQVTDQPVATVAALVGYDSPSRFAARFRQRFGHPPGAIRDQTESAAIRDQTEPVPAPTPTPAPTRLSA